jgi:hypothetical protein
MSDLAAILVGLGIGFLIGLPALVVYRHDIARSFRRLLKSPEAESAEQEQPEAVPQADGLAGDFDEDTEGLSPAIATFGIGAGALTAFYGALSGGVVFLASGIFVALSVGVAFIVSMAIKS